MNVFSKLRVWRFKGGILRGDDKERQSTREVLLRLAAHGCPVDVSVIESEINIEQEDPKLTHIFELNDSRSGYVIDVRISNHGSKSIFIETISLIMPWPDDHFEWLPDPRKMETKFAGLYCFPANSGPEFSRDLVLNHVLLNGHGTLHPKRVISGFLLGTGWPSPPDLIRGCPIEGTLTIHTQDDIQYSNTIRFWRIEQHSISKPPAFRPSSPEAYTTDDLSIATWEARNVAMKDNALFARHTRKHKS